LAHHFTQAGLTEAAVEWCGKAGQRSLARSALAEAAEQFRRALGQAALLPSTPALRREEIKLQVALLTALFHVKGFSAPETKLAAERAHELIRQAESLGEPPEDPLLLFSVLYSYWVASYATSNGHEQRELATQFLALAEKQKETAPLMIGHRLMGVALTFTGSIAQGRESFDRAIALYDAAAHRPLATRFGLDARIAILSYRPWALWLLGYPEAALKDIQQALKDGREDGQAPTLMYAMFHTSIILIHCGEYATAKIQADELAALADEKGTPLWKSNGLCQQGCVLVMTGKPADAVQAITAGIAAYRSTGATANEPHWLTFLAGAYAKLGQFEDAWRCINEAMTEVETTEERWYEAEVNRVAGEISLMFGKLDRAKAQAYFGRALAVARQQQAKSWELRAAMSMARLSRDQGKRDEARDLLAPVYGWFTEGFDTRDLKEAKALLEELAA
jgi:predicted ATPase